MHTCLITAADRFTYRDTGCSLVSTLWRQCGRVDNGWSSSNLLLEKVPGDVTAGPGFGHPRGESWGMSKLFRG